VLIVITGPIASGKSTMARAVARELESRAKPAAVIDLDVVYELFEHDGAPKEDETKWRRARRAAAALTTSALEGGDAAILDADVLTPGASELLLYLRGDTKPLIVALSVSFAGALGRVDADSTRTASRDRAFLRRHYDVVDEALRSFASIDLAIDTEVVPAEEAARTIADAALAHSRPSRYLP
jgi:chloramphenicol 3-O-phosphotransferase